MIPSLPRDASTGAAPALTGVLHKPGGAGPFPAIVTLHGCAGLFSADGKMAARDAQWAEFLLKHGFVVLMMDSFGPRGVTNVCAQTAPVVDPQRDRQYDAYAALAYLRTLPFVRGDRVGIMGWSQGGATVLYAIDSQAAARPAALPGGDFRAAVAFYPGWCNGKSHRSGWSSAIPLLALLGASDNWTPAAPCRYFLEQAARGGAEVEVVVYPGAYHDFDWPDMPLRAVTSVSIGRGGNPMVGTNPAASEDAHRRVLDYFERRLTTPTQ